MCLCFQGLSASFWKQLQHEVLFDSLIGYILLYRAAEHRLKNISCICDLSIENEK